MQDHVRYQEAAERVQEQEREKKEAEENSVAIELGLTTRNRKHKESGNVSEKGTKTFTKTEKISVFQKDYFTIQEAAAYSGTHPSAISKWMKRKKFPYIRMGNVIRIPRESFENYINQHMKISKDACKD